jgi:nitrite reductase (NADH) large subunit
MVGEQLPGDALGLIAPVGSDSGSGGLGVGGLPTGAQMRRCEVGR